MLRWWFDHADNPFDKMPCGIPGHGCHPGGDCLRCSHVHGVNPPFLVKLLQCSRQYKPSEERDPGCRGVVNSHLRGQFPSDSYGVVVFQGHGRLRFGGGLLDAMRTLRLSTLSRTLDKTITSIEMELLAARSLQESLLNGSPVVEKLKISESIGSQKYHMVKRGKSLKKRRVVSSLATVLY